MDKKFFIYIDENNRKQFFDISLIAFTDFYRGYYRIYFSNTSHNDITPYVKLDVATFNNLYNYIYNEYEIKRG